jgi:hypothetical protein
MEALSACLAEGCDDCVLKPRPTVPMAAMLADSA